HELTLIRIDYGFLPKLLFQRCADVIGKDLRIYVLGNKMLAAMMRISSGSDFRANFSLGGHAIPHTLTNEETALAKKIITALPADFVGIDFLYHKDHPVLSEIEDVVGTRMLYQHTNIHAVREYLNYILLSMQNTTA
ncbi:MAG TPA: hypothetical protein PLU43_06795, partial [Lachnospiraceae bacterium]|nr:hypothetical protein [Lachnospiraceae bacterium]